MLDTLRFEISRWGGAVRARFDADQPHVLGWQVPFLGCGAQFGSLGPRWMEAALRRRGTPLTLYLLGKRVTFGDDPEFVERFYSAGTEEVSFFAGLQAFPGMSELVPIGLSGPEGASVAIKVLRRNLSARVNSVGPALDAEIGLALREGLATGRAELLQTFRVAILRVTALLLFGERLTHNAQFISAVCDFDMAMLGMVRSLRHGRHLARGLEARERSVALILHEIKRRRAEGPPAEPGDITDAFMRARDPEDKAIADEVIAMEMHAFMFATVANTHAAAAMCLLQLLSSPALSARVLAEQDACVVAHGDVITPAAMRAMPTLQACYLETLRIYSPALHLRMAVTPIRVGAYTLPARSLVGFSPYVLHRDPAIYADPDVFDPDRFLAGPRSPASAPPKSHFIPYGRGVHACLGRSLARQEIILAIARLLRDFDVTVEPRADLLAATWLTNGIAAPAGPRILTVRPRRTTA